MVLTPNPYSPIHTPYSPIPTPYSHSQIPKTPTFIKKHFLTLVIILIKIKKMEIANDKIVKITYEGKLTDGEVFDTSEGKEPLEFMFGAGLIIPGLEKGLEGLKIGDKKTINIKPEEAYGPRMEEAKQEVPKSQFPEDMELKEGMQLAAQGPQGVIPVVVAEIKEDSVIVDFNHPLAGKDLTFDIEVVEVRDATDDDKTKYTAHHHHHEEEETGCCGGGNCSTDKKDPSDKKEGCCGGNCHN